MRILSLNADDIVITENTLNTFDFVVELEAGETISDYERIQNLTNEEILDESDSDEDPIWLQGETLEGLGYSEYSELGAIDREDVIFVRVKDLTENLNEEEINTCAFYVAHPGGFAYEIVNHDSD